MRIPHPIPYQGSKRAIAPYILQYFPHFIDILYEPFAGSAAVTIASAARSLAKKHYINDLNKPLMDLWKMIINEPDKIYQLYNKLWKEQLNNPREFYDKIREKFNLTGRPDYFLYLLARCVKGSIRYNANGEFNQSPDNRRKGAHPETMRSHILGVSHLLKGKTIIDSKNYRDVLAQVTKRDLVYMDPPYQGVCGNRDTRYLANIQFCEFVSVLEDLNKRYIRYIVSYDGRTGTKVHGKVLPEHLDLIHVEIEAGTSSQETLLGRRACTIESLYLSPALANEIGKEKNYSSIRRVKQLSLVETVI